MKIAILGTGMVGATLATKLVQIGHAVCMGSRDAHGAAAQEWLRSVDGKAQSATFADAAAFGEIIFNCTNGANSIPALRLAGAANLRDKVLVDVANPLEFVQGTLQLTVCNTDSLGEQIQREFPAAKVVKALNTVNCAVMINPALAPGGHQLLVCGNDSAAKSQVTRLISEWFGWKGENFVDLGDITGARCTEMYLPLWLRLMNTLGTPHFNIRLAVGAKNV
jgi:predicted dinucleotide-binding enzyme